MLFAVTGADDVLHAQNGGHRQVGVRQPPKAVGRRHAVRNAVQHPVEAALPAFFQRLMHLLVERFRLRARFRSARFDSSQSRPLRSAALPTARSLRPKHSWPRAMSCCSMSATGRTMRFSSTAPVTMQNAGPKIASGSVLRSRVEQAPPAGLRDGKHQRSDRPARRFDRCVGIRRSSSPLASDVVNPGRVAPLFVGAAAIGRGRPICSSHSVGQ